MEPQSPEKMVRQRGIKNKYLIYFYFFLPFGLLLSCDPSHSLVIQNYSQSEILFEVKTQDSIYFDSIIMADSTFYRRIDHELYTDIIPIIKSDSNRYSFKLPSQHSAIVFPGGIGHIPIDWVIMEVADMRDTIFTRTYNSFTNIPSNIKMRSSGFMLHNRIINIYDPSPVK